MPIAGWILIVSIVAIRISLPGDQDAILLSLPMTSSSA
jgi:hypothetical protein